LFFGKSKNIKGGIIGCGRITRDAHIPVFRKPKEVKIIAVCDINEKISTETAKKFGIPGVYGNFSSMLREEDLDFIDICSPPQTHCQLVLQAMEAGLHILVEKPMAINLNEAEEMITSSEKNNVKLCEIHNFSFNPIIQKAKSLINMWKSDKKVDIVFN